MLFSYLQSICNFPQTATQWSHVFFTGWFERKTVDSERMLVWLFNNETGFVLVPHASLLLQNWHLSNFRAIFKILSTSSVVRIEYLSSCVYQMQDFVLSFKTIWSCAPLLTDGTLFKLFNGLKVNRHFLAVLYLLGLKWRLSLTWKT